MSWDVIFRDAVSGVAGVVVYDKGRTDGLGRYVVAKSMKTNGKYFQTQSYYSQRPPAITYPRSFLRERAAKAGKEYTPGDGKNTILYEPVAADGNPPIRSKEAA